ncbi:hypothetical protein F4777DRAFT_579449 [Nemania sp. FL0916]|nr:hypothetical protein F4777DRAFT_579449 [Nemania sp. FL0916]
MSYPITPPAARRGSVQPSASTSSNSPHGLSLTGPASTTVPSGGSGSSTMPTADGTWIYMGNLNPSARLEDIEFFLRAWDFDQFTGIQFSYDHIRHQRRSLCFIGFPDADSAHKAIKTLKGKTFENRTVDCWLYNGPINKADGGDDQSKLESLDTPSYESVDARLFVSGLQPTSSQIIHFTEISTLFDPFGPHNITKRFNLHKRGEVIDHYCFVQFKTAEQAEKARKSVERQLFHGNHLYVVKAKPRAKN